MFGDNRGNASSILRDEEETNDESKDPLSDPTKSVDEILEEMKFDSSFEDMLSYISSTGMFNMQLPQFNKEWS